MIIVSKRVHFLNFDKWVLVYYFQQLLFEIEAPDY